METSVLVQERLQLEKELRSNLLVNAFEGGSNYWYFIEDHNKKEIPECEFLSELLNFEGAWMVIKSEDGEKRVTHLDVLKAWEVFRTDSRFRNRYVEVLDGNDDAETADIFLQLAVFGEIIFG